MTDQNDISFASGNRSPHDSDILLQRSCRILRHEYFMALIAQDAMDTGPAGSVNEGTVDQHDGCSAFADGCHGVCAHDVHGCDSARFPRISMRNTFTPPSASA